MSTVVNMSEENLEQKADEASQEGTTEEGGEVAPKSSKKKKIILLILILVIIAGGITGYIMYQKKKEQAAAEEAAKQAAETTNESIYHDLDEIIVNLNTEGKGVSFMKLKITLELEKKSDFDVLIKMLPRVNDVFQVYLRELKPTDMQGSIGIYRLREELLLRINKVLYPAKVKDILFKEVLVQ